ncbi:unnamed protein product [Camellia sinensis]
MFRAFLMRTYYAAVIENCTDFVGRVGVDVSAGSSILSLFAAGAKHVYAVEASEMAEYARKLIAGNPLLAQRITVVKGKVEVELPEKVDILISEPMGTLIHMAPFSDEYLYVEIANKALFWQQRSYYEVDLTPLYGSAFQGYFSQEELYEIDVPLKFKAPVGTRIHGLACWFDVLFDGSTALWWLSTAPGAPTTHWYQLHCILSQPLYVMPGQEITGRLPMIAHNAQSYSINLTMTTKSWGAGAGAGQGGIVQTSSGKFDLKEPYYQMSQPQAYSIAQDQPTHHLTNTQDIQIQSQNEEGFELMHQPSQNVDIEYIELTAAKDGSG